ncbi:hypothetical protein L2E82_16938 [Cichorium intybus]|uniref:Uncharacterized protein n=1 Tax=Cichorium intybus TaxID=13427 RepID=A0ACB9F7W7_CICIN|nr:hypothetical protein L2E82_16938 [Cichorium intybus]
MRLMDAFVTNPWKLNPTATFLFDIDSVDCVSSSVLVKKNRGFKIAETAKKHKIVVIADEVYGHLAFGQNPFCSHGCFGSMVPILTLGSLSKRWIVPGWRLGWFCSIVRDSFTEADDILKLHDIVHCSLDVVDERVKEKEVRMAIASRSPAARDIAEILSRELGRLQTQQILGNQPITHKEVELKAIKVPSVII